VLQRDNKVCAMDGQAAADWAVVLHVYYIEENKHTTQFTQCQIDWQCRLHHMHRLNSCTSLIVQKQDLPQSHFKLIVLASSMILYFLFILYIVMWASSLFLSSSFDLLSSFSGITQPQLSTQLCFDHI